MSKVQQGLRPVATASDRRGPGSPALRGRHLSRRLISAGPPIALVALWVVFGALNNKFLGASNLRGIADQTAILLVLAVGMTFVILLGGIDLSVEGVMATSSLVVALLAANDRNSNNFGMLAVLAGVAVGALFGLVNGLLHTRLKVPSFMVTLGMGAIGVGIATVLFAGRAPRVLDAGIRAWGLNKWMGFSQLAFVAVVVLLLGWGIQRFTRVGRYAYVIGGDEEIARLSGIPIRRYKTLAFVISGSTAGLAGAMAASRLGVGDVQIGGGQMFATITAVVVGGTLLTGGRGGVLKTVVGALIIATLANGLILVGVDPYVQRSVQGIVIVIAVATTGWNLRTRVRTIK
jgi:ribose transport system permease protein